MNLLNFKKTASIAFASTLSLMLFFTTSCEKESLLPTEEENIAETPTSLTKKSSNSVEIGYNSISASTQQSSNPIGNIDDSSMTTRWSGFGSAVHVDIDFGSVVRVDYINIAFFKGDERTVSYDYLESSNGSSYSYVGGKTSSGNTEGHEEFDLKNMDTRYLRLTFKGNSTNDWNSVLDLEIFGTGGVTPPPNPPTGGGTAASILGGLTNWKLNAYSGNLNVGSSDNGLNYADSASKSDNDDWFYENNGYAYFKCYPGNPTSGGSSNPRTELRQMTSNGSSEIYWDGDSNTEHSMKWRFRIDDLPPSGKLCFGQIHERDDDYDDIIRVQCQGSAGQNSGSIDLRILGYVTEELEGEGRTIDFNFNMDTEYYFELTMQNGVVKLYNLNTSGSRTSTLFTSQDVGNADENYFKAGCYLQSTSSSDSGSSTYGLVGIKTLIVN